MQGLQGVLGPQAAWPWVESGDNLAGVRLPSVLHSAQGSGRWRHTPGPPALDLRAVLGTWDCLCSPLPDTLNTASWVSLVS